MLIIYITKTHHSSSDLDPSETKIKTHFSIDKLSELFYISRDKGTRQTNTGRAAAYRSKLDSTIWRKNVSLAHRSDKSWFNLSIFLNVYAVSVFH